VSSANSRIRVFLASATPAPNGRILSILKDSLPFCPVVLSYIEGILIVIFSLSRFFPSLTSLPSSCGLRSFPFPANPLSFPTPPPYEPCFPPPLYFRYPLISLMTMRLLHLRFYDTRFFHGVGALPAVLFLTPTTSNQYLSLGVSKGLAPPSLTSSRALP